VRGIIEGFYGPPWSWQERVEVGRSLGEAGMDTYVYAPKDDPLHRARWREPYPDEVLREFGRLVDEQPLRVGFCVSPGLSIDAQDAEDRRALLAKFEQLTARGVTLVGVLFDDLDPAPGLGAAHGQLTSWLREQLGADVDLFTVPLHYTGTTSSDYLDELVGRVPPDVPIGWTGRHVVNESISAEDARARAAVTDGRAPLLWDNTPVNDVLMQHRLSAGPLRGRDPGLLAELSGYLANPMVQARASLPALRSAAAWCAGEDPETAWQLAAAPNRVLLEGVDGVVPAQLAAAALGGDAAALDELEGWFGAATSCDVGDLGDQVRPWVEQLHAEAEVGRVVCGLLRAEPDEAARAAPLLYVMWPLPPGDVSVLGGRGELLPAMTQDRRSRWVATGESYRSPANVVDRLVQAVFARLP
jgi:hyaluronoglucosaminidase